MLPQGASHIYILFLFLIFNLLSPLAEGISINYQGAMENQEILDYLYSSRLITDDEYKFGRKIQKAYRKLKEFRVTPKMDSLGTRGGPPVSLFEPIAESNRAWNYFVKMATEQELRIVEAYIGREVKYSSLPTGAGADEVLDSVIATLANLLDRFTARAISYSCENVTLRVRRAIDRLGIEKTARLANLGYHTVKRFLENDGASRFDTFLRLTRALNLKVYVF
jgi:DNA-binding phage protein